MVTLVRYHVIELLSMSILESLLLPISLSFFSEECITATQTSRPESALPCPTDAFSVSSE
jgi:hypothetical protein